MVMMQQRGDIWVVMLQAKRCGIAIVIFLVWEDACRTQWQSSWNPLEMNHKWLIGAVHMARQSRLRTFDARSNMYKRYSFMENNIPYRNIACISRDRGGRMNGETLAFLLLLPLFRFGHVFSAFASWFETLLRHTMNVTTPYLVSVASHTRH